MAARGPGAGLLVIPCHNISWLGLLHLGSVTLEYSLSHTQYINISLAFLFGTEPNVKQTVPFMAAENSV